MLQVLDHLFLCVCTAKCDLEKCLPKSMLPYDISGESFHVHCGIVHKVLGLPLLECTLLFECNHNGSSFDKDAPFTMHDLYKHINKYQVHWIALCYSIPMRSRGFGM